MILFFSSQKAFTLSLCRRSSTSTLILIEEQLLQKVYFSTHLPENEEERIALVKEKLLETLRLLYERGYLRASSRSDSALRFCSPLRSG